MGYKQILQQQLRFFLRCASATVFIFFIASGCVAQDTLAGQPDMPWSADLKKYPGLMGEVAKLVDKLQHNLQFPPVRVESHLLSLLPETTTVYSAFPNYGDATHQALNIFRQELQESPVLRAWWQHGELAAGGPKIEDSLEKFYHLSQYLGDEIVISGATGPDPSLLILAEVRKPGLYDFLQRMVKDLAGKSMPAVRILDQHELASAKDQHGSQQFVVLVRPDFVVASLDLTALRNFNAQLDRTDREFVSTPFGQRLAQAYQGGAEILAAADLQKIVKQLPQGAQRNLASLQRTGFADMKYLVWEHKSVAGQSASQAELSFTGPRHRVASWLAAPAPLRSLDFVSPNALLAGTAVLKSPGEIFEDVKDLSSTSPNPTAFAAIPQMEAALNLNLKDDLLRHLGGEITLELDNLVQQVPVWKAILAVSDPDRLQQTLIKLMAAAQITTHQFNEDGITYHSVRIPSPNKTLEIGYAFVDGYLVIASSHEQVTEAIRLHESADSLAKSKKFLASLPPGHSSDASALLYEDPIAMAALTMRWASPQMAASLSQLTAQTTPVLICAYADESALREASKTAGMDAGMVMMAAAIAIPNLLRSRIAANEASAAGMVRTVDTAQVMYSSTYPQRGYARDLASLGPDPRGARAESAEHADLIDATLGNASCTGGPWCTKSGFRFRITAVCKKQLCDDFVVVGTPVANNTGGRNFCSTSDGVVRFQIGPPLTSPVSVPECQAWSPLQ